MNELAFTPARSCPYQSCWHNHPELRRHWEDAPVLEARDPQPAAAPEPEPETRL
jgi:hypothetical protein